MVIAYSFRNTSVMEGIHAGITPVSRMGDFYDVVVVEAAGNKILWNKGSRISQAEMKGLIQTAVIASMPPSRLMVMPSLKRKF